jgi:hypothetical protein
MKQEEIVELAKTTCSWLAYKSLTGYEDIFVEAMLSVPISEFLASRKDWMLEQEGDYRKLLNAGALPRIWYDFSGRRRFGKGIDFLLETKFLKSAAEKTARGIAADVIRLSLPRQELTRIFLLAGRSEYFSKLGNSTLLTRLFGLGRQKGCNIRSSHALLVPGFAKAFSPLVEALEKGYAPEKIYVQCRAIEESPALGNTSYKVIVWTVARTT